MAHKKGLSLLLGDNVPVDSLVHGMAVGLVGTAIRSE